MQYWRKYLPILLVLLFYGVIAISTFRFERLVQFAPSVAVMGLLWGGTAVYFWQLKKRMAGQLTAEYITEHPFKVQLTFGFPALVVLAPAAEELIFRAPLLLLFDSFTPLAAVALAVSSVLFAAAHWWNGETNHTELLKAVIAEENAEKDVEELAKKVVSEHPTSVRHKFGHALARLPAGFLFGYIALSTQSLWMSFGVHALWNLFAAAVLPILMLIFVVVGSMIYGLVVTFLVKHKIMRKWPKDFFA